MKQCRKCGEQKPLSEFYKMAGMRDGHRNECIVCSGKAAKRRYLANPAPNIDRAARWARENPERYRERMRRYQASGLKAQSDRKSHLKRKFGITVEHYDALLVEQGGGCAICGRPPRDDISLHVDHDHDTGRVRGLLCFPCNNALGLFHERPDRLNAAQRYLDSSPEAAEETALIRKRVADLALTSRRDGRPGVSAR